MASSPTIFSSVFKITAKGGKAQKLKNFQFNVNASIAIEPGSEPQETYLLISRLSELRINQLTATNFATISLNTSGFNSYSVSMANDLDSESASML